MKWSTTWANIACSPLLFHSLFIHTPIHNTNITPINTEPNTTGDSCIIPLNISFGSFFQRGSFAIPFSQSLPTLIPPLKPLENNNNQ
jgi:hypothetical protein